MKQHAPNPALVISKLLLSFNHISDSSPEGIQLTRHEFTGFILPCQLKVETENYVIQST